MFWFWKSLMIWPRHGALNNYFKDLYFALSRGIRLISFWLQFESLEKPTQVAWTLGGQAGHQHFPEFYLYWSYGYKIFKYNFYWNSKCKNHSIIVFLIKICFFNSKSGQFYSLLPSEVTWGHFGSNLDYLGTKANYTLKHSS